MGGDHSAIDSFPSRWPIHKIRDFAEVKGGKRLPAGTALVSTRTNHPYLRIVDFKDGRIDKTALLYVPNEVFPRIARYTISSKDIYISIVGTIGLVGVVDDELDGANLTENAAKICNIAAHVDRNYLAIYLRSEWGQHQIRTLTVGSTQPKLALFRIADIHVPLPPLPEQRAIAHILGTLDDKIELNRRMNETLEAMARALFKSWFIDFDPVRSKMNGRLPAPSEARQAGWRKGESLPLSAVPGTAQAGGLPAHLYDLFPDSFVDSELGKIPRGWRIGGFPEEIDFLEGPGLRNWQYRDAGMKFLNIRCIVDGDLDIDKANAISLEEFEETYSQFALREDDIVISTSGTLGRLAIVRQDHLPIMLNTSIIRMRGREPIGLVYVWGLLQSAYFLDEMFALAAGSVQLNFGPMHLRKIRILRPPDNVLSTFENVTLPLIRKTLHNRQQSRTLAALRDTLLPKLISGELRVKEAERFLEERGL